jgi:predicted dehydrogenase
MKAAEITRRDFMRLGTGAALAGANVCAASSAIETTLLEAPPLSAQAPPSGRKTRFALIGAGIRGCDLLRAAKTVPTGVCAGTADLYDIRHKGAQEVYGGEFPTTRDYRELLGRKDVDAVIVATADHQHKRIVLDAIAAGKDVYCEKPMSHTVADGFAMVEAVQAGKQIFQAGSQRVSSILYAKAREIYASGRLGEVHQIDAKWNRNTPGGAWLYPVPADASAENVDWDAFVRDAPPRPFDATRFFRWRLFSDYGEGLGGDLFVHLISGIQVITGMNTVASRAYSSGGLYHYRDGRDFPDQLETIYDYPDAPDGGLQVHLHCNQNNDDGDEGLSFFGSMGTLVVTGRTVTFTPQETAPRFEAYGWGGMTEAQRKQGLEDWRAAHPQPAPAVVKAPVESYALPQGYNDTASHLANFFRAVETREPVVEDEVFGNNAAIGCHLANYSYFHKTIAKWDAETKTIKG